MFGHRLPAGNTRRACSGLIAAFTIAVLINGSTEVAAQGPPDGLPGVGPVVLEGEFEATYEDDDDRGRLLHFLHSNNRRIPLRFQNDNAPDLPTGTRVRVRGNLADGAVTEAIVTALASSTARTMGPQDVLVILFNFSNNPTQPMSASTIASVNEQVRNFYLENTYGQTVLSFTVVGWYTIASTDSPCDYSSWGAQAEAKATSAGVNLAAYDRIVVAFPRATACNWNGVGNLGGPRSWVNGSYSVRTMAHEQGHNFGDHHSKASRCDSSACTTVEYGDDRDVLGKSGVVGHLNAFQKERLGWLNYGSSPAITTVTSSGDYWIDNYEGIAGNTKALRVWNPAKSAYYYVESRARMGFDGNIAAGVTLHSGISGTSYQVDLDPLTTTYDSTLDVGQVFTDAAIGLSVQTVSTSVDGALIRVSLGTVPCSYRPPTVSMSSTAPLQYTVTVKNNNGSTCAASTVSLAAALPAGWSGSFSPASSASLSPGASASATLLLGAPSGTSGTYPFSVTATDASSGQSATATGSATVATSLTVTASAVVNSGNGNNRSASITVGVKSGTQAVPGAAVTVVVTGPQGAKSTLSATSDGNGVATVKFSLKPKDPSGAYQVQATASGGGAAGQAATSFNVP